MSLLLGQMPALQMGISSHYSFHDRDGYWYSWHSDLWVKSVTANLHILLWALATQARFQAVTSSFPPELAEPGITVVTLL